MEKVIRVAKITVESYNKLVDAGYTVAFASVTPKPSSFAKYHYHRTVLSVQPVRTIEELKLRVCTKHHALED